MLDKMELNDSSDGVMMAHRQSTHGIKDVPLIQ